MRLSSLTPAHVRQAIAIYVDHGWPMGISGAPKGKLDELAACQSLSEMRSVFSESFSESISESSSEGGADGERGCRRFTLRLGNERYPWMKFVIQEYLVAGEFFFSVDTHDDLRVDPTNPDYERWCQLQLFNRELKRKLSLIHI